MYVVLGLGPTHFKPKGPVSLVVILFFKWGLHDGALVVILHFNLLEVCESSHCIHQEVSWAVMDSLHLKHQEDLGPLCCKH